MREDVMAAAPAWSFCLQRGCLRSSASAAETFAFSDTHFLITREIIDIIPRLVPAKMNLFIQYIPRVPSVCQCCRAIVFKCQA